MIIKNEESLLDILNSEQKHVDELNKIASYIRTFGCDKNLEEQYVDCKKQINKDRKEIGLRLRNLLENV